MSVRIKNILTLPWSTPKWCVSTSLVLMLPSSSRLKTSSVTYCVSFKSKSSPMKQLGTTSPVYYSCCQTWFVRAVWSARMSTSVETTISMSLISWTTQATPSPSSGSVPVGNLSVSSLLRDDSSSYSTVGWSPTRCRICSAPLAKWSTIALWTKGASAQRLSSRQLAMFFPRSCETRIFWTRKQTSSFSRSCYVTLRSYTRWLLCRKQLPKCSDSCRCLISETNSEHYLYSSLWATLKFRP